MARILMKGNEALAEAAIRAGCRFYSGYPITPQTEILEYMSWRMPEVGGEFIQTESELAGINMVFGAAASGARAMSSSSGPGFSLMQEGISYLCSDEIPAVLIDVQRIGSGLGDIFQGQGDYWQMTRGGGNGDYRTIVLAPACVQENADFAVLAFELAERYRLPVIIGSDAAIGQMVEAVELPPMQEHDINQYDWTLKPRRSGKLSRVVCTFYDMGMDKFPAFLVEKLNRIAANEQRWESIATEDAEIVLVSYGISSRICKEAVKQARVEGIKLGLIRCCTLWPFPKLAFDALGESVKAFMSVDMSILGQMNDDIIVATNGKYPVGHYGEFSEVPSCPEIIKRAKIMLAGL